MGLIRKTVSISTFGVVPFRSRKELLRRAEGAQSAAAAELERERSQRDAADRRVSAAEKRAVEAELQALQVARRLAKAKKSAEGSRRKRRRARRAAATAALTSAVSTAEAT